MSQVNPTTEVDLSLVLCTYGRTNEVDNFLKSISAQTAKPSEIIIVDQNEENILFEILKKWKTKLPIIHERVDFKGASKIKKLRRQKSNIYSYSLS